MTLEQLLNKERSRKEQVAHIRKQYTKFYQQGLMTSNELTRLMTDVMMITKKRIEIFAEMTTRQGWFDYLEKRHVMELLAENSSIEDLFDADREILLTLKGDEDASIN